MEDDLYPANGMICLFPLSCSFVASAPLVEADEVDGGNLARRKNTIYKINKSKSMCFTQSPKLYCPSNY